MHRVIFGLEYQAASVVALRGGYLTPFSTQRIEGENAGLGNVTGFVGGFGLALFNHTLDYAFTPFGTLGETHRFSLSFQF